MACSLPFPSPGLRLVKADCISLTVVWESASSAEVAHCKSTKLAFCDSRDFLVSPPLGAHSRDAVFPLWGSEVAFQFPLTLESSQFPIPGTQPLRLPEELSRPGAGGDRCSPADRSLRTVARFHFSEQPRLRALAPLPRGHSLCPSAHSSLLITGEPGNQEGQVCWEPQQPCCCLAAFVKGPCCHPFPAGCLWLRGYGPAAFLPPPMETGPLSGAVRSAAHSDQTPGKFLFLLREPLVSLEDLLLTVGCRCS